MENEGCPLPKEALATWNAELPDGTGGTIHELTKALKSFLLKRMKTDWQVGAVQLGSWLRRNGWMKERIWKTNHWTKGGLNAHTPWYIDFANGPFHCSTLAFTKSVIFLNREEPAPRVYWELRNFAKAINASNDKFNMYVWWSYQKRLYEELRTEFNFDELTLRPCRRACVKLGSAAPTLCTKETILATNGLIVMLLRWVMHSKAKANQDAAKAVLIDFRNRLMSGVNGDDEVWSSFTSGSLPKDPIESPDTDEGTSGPEQDGERQDTHNGDMARSHSACKALAERMICVFANRKKSESWKACFVYGLKMLETRLTTVVLTGKVGQMSPVLPSTKGIKRSMEIENPKGKADEVQHTKVRKTAVRSAGSSKESNHEGARKVDERRKSKNKTGRRLAKEASTGQRVT